MNNKFLKATTYVVIFWDDTNSEILKEEAYPMHIYSFEDVVLKLKGQENKCDIYEGRFYKRRSKYITVGKTFIWVVLAGLLKCSQ